MVSRESQLAEINHLYHAIASYNELWFEQYLHLKRWDQITVTKISKEI